MWDQTGGYPCLNASYIILRKEIDRSPSPVEFVVTNETLKADQIQSLYNSSFLNLTILWDQTGTHARKESKSYLYVSTRREGIFIDLIQLYIKR